MGVSARDNVVRAAVVQMDVRIGEVEWNLRRVLERLEEAAAHGAKLVIFPECVLSGYCFGSLEEARESALAWPGNEWDLLKSACSRHRVTIVIGFLEFRRGRMYNAALLDATCSEGRGLVTYNKTHLPVLGVDRMVEKGRKLSTWQTDWGILGILICYDIRFPEAARVLALQGADIIALPTNWPEGAESSPDFLTRARAWENRVYILAANRVGVERGRRFIGRSQIVSPTGEILREAGADEETILYADLDLELARNKKIVIEPGEWEMDVIGGRRPELYGELTKATKRD